MAKLRDDHIRWILDIDAKGVQAEFKAIISETDRLNKNNDILSKTIKKTESELKNQIRELNNLEKSGKTAGITYEKLRERIDANQEYLKVLNSRFNDNSKKIEENNKKHSELIKTAKLTDLTMSQLRQRAEQLQIQLNNTSVSLSPEAYKKLQKELEQVNLRMFTVQGTGKSMLQQFASMHNPVGQAAKAVLGFGQALKVLIANPVGAVIMVVVAAFTALQKIINTNEESVNSLNRILAPMKLLFDSILNVIQKLVISFLNFIETVITGFAKLLERVPFLSKFMGEMNKKAEEAKQLEIDKQALMKRNREALVENAEKERRIAELRNNAVQRDKYNATQRIEMLKEAIRLEDEIVQNKIETAKEELRILEIELARTENTRELNDKIAEQKALIIGLSTEYYNKTKKDEKAISAAVIENQREAAAAAKEVLDKRLKDEENALNEQINQLKKSRLEGIKTEDEYNREVDRLTIESLHRKITIKGQEKDKILQLEAQILDAQFKQQTEADKELLEALTKDKDQKLQVLDSMRNESLEILQEQESDQKIYALRAAEIEAEYSQMRLDVVHAFGQEIEQAEFQNAKIREKAIEDTGKEIIKSEQQNLKEQERLRKLFARTNAEFDRLYNIKTWEQRKEDELRILNKQHELGLISEEVYQLAIIALNKKYEDEKLKVKQQYGIASMRDYYNAEIEALQELHSKGLLNEEEYQKAILEIKLKYAQEYADKTQELTKIASDVVKSLEQAQTASLSAEYTKRQSALIKQYNDGILSKEEYNAQKEQLDYEEKSKELELNKKYADVNFAMQASEIISSGATAAINAYKALAGIPIVGPALGAAAAALVAVTTGLRLKQAKAERDRVKAMTLESPGGGGGGPRTGTIQLREGFAEGGPNMSSGGYTGSGSKYEVKGYLPIHGSEYVIAQEELRQPEIMNMARAIERVRRKRTTKNTVTGFADGGSNDPDKFDAAAIMTNGKIASQMLAVLQRISSGDITVQTNYGITEMEAEQRRKQEIENKFTKK